MIMHDLGTVTRKFVELCNKKGLFDSSLGETPAFTMTLSTLRCYREYTAVLD